MASDIYNNKIVAEKSYMQTTNTRVVTFEMCGNDGLQARSSFKGQTGTCNYGVMDTALNNCTTYQQRAMTYINANAYAGTKLKVIANLYYPGYNADNVLSTCTDRRRRQGEHARQVPPLHREDELEGLQLREHLRLQVRGQLRAVHGRATTTATATARSTRTALKYVQGETRGGLRHAHHGRR